MTPQKYSIQNIQNGYILIVYNSAPDVLKLSLEDGVYLFPVGTVLSIVVTALVAITGEEGYDVFGMGQSQGVFFFYQAINSPMAVGDTLTLNPITMTDHIMLLLPSLEEE